MDNIGSTMALRIDEQDPSRALPWQILRSIRSCQVPVLPHGAEGKFALRLQLKQCTDTIKTLVELVWT